MHLLANGGQYLFFIEAHDVTKKNKWKLLHLFSQTAGHVYLYFEAGN